MPAKLDHASYVFGLEKYGRSQQNLGNDEFEQVFAWVDAIVGPYLCYEKPFTVLESIATLKLEKSPGYPYTSEYGVTKASVLEQFYTESGDVDEFDYFAAHAWLVDQFRTRTPVFNTCLKDELRPVGKNARLYCPGSISHTYMGAVLFGHQNEGLMRSLHRHPIVLGAQIPGADLIQVFAKHRKHGGQHYDFDAQQWDASFVAWTAFLLRELRKKYLSEEFWPDADRYYDSTYFSHALFYGQVIILPGQKSGQYLTAHDNSLSQLCLLCLHGLRSGLSLDEFRTLVKPSLSGDDILLSDKTTFFHPLALATTYESQGVYLETSSLAGKLLEDCQFLACYPTVYEYNQRRVQLYRFKSAKLLCSLNYTIIGRSKAEMFSKLCSIAMLLFTDIDVFSSVRARVKTWFADGVAEGWDPDPGSLRLFQMINSPEELYRMFTRIEDSRVTGGSFFTPEAFVESLRPCAKVATRRKFNEFHKTNHNNDNYRQFTPKPQISRSSSLASCFEIAQSI